MKYWSIGNAYLNHPEHQILLTVVTGVFLVYMYYVLFNRKSENKLKEAAGVGLVYLVMMAFLLFTETIFEVTRNLLR